MLRSAVPGGKGREGYVSFGGGFFLSPYWLVEKNLEICFLDCMELLILRSSSAQLCRDRFREAFVPCCTARKACSLSRDCPPNLRVAISA